jgi:hypothetical protein
VHHHHAEQSLNRLAASATTHCLTGCAIGEVLGVAIGTALGWSNLPTIVLAIVLAFFFGYGFTSWPLLRSGMALAAVVPIALASDTLSITIMEIVDNAILLVIPGAMEAGLADVLFWASLAFALAVAWVAAFPVNRNLIARGRGHAVVHAHHGHHCEVLEPAGADPGRVVPAAEARDLDDVTGVRRMDEGAAADVNPVVSEPIEEHEITRLQLAAIDWCAVGVLRRCVMREGHTDLRVDIHHEP